MAHCSRCGGEVWLCCRDHGPLARATAAGWGSATSPLQRTASQDDDEAEERARIIADLGSDDGNPAAGMLGEAPFGSSHGTGAEVSDEGEVAEPSAERPEAGDLRRDEMGLAQASPSMRKVALAKVAGAVLGASVLVASGYALGRHAGAAVRNDRPTLMDTFEEHEHKHMTRARVAKLVKFEKAADDKPLQRVKDGHEVERGDEQVACKVTAAAEQDEPEAPGTLDMDVGTAPWLESSPDDDSAEEEVRSLPLESTVSRESDAALLQSMP